MRIAILQLLRDDVLQLLYALVVDGGPAVVQQDQLRCRVTARRAIAVGWQARRGRCWLLLVCSALLAVLLMVLSTDAAVPALCRRLRLCTRLPCSCSSSSGRMTLLGTRSSSQSTRNRTVDRLPSRWFIHIATGRSQPITKPLALLDTAVHRRSCNRSTHERAQRSTERHTCKHVTRCSAPHST